MKRSEMELNIATNIVITKPYIDFKEAQALAEIALISVLENGMLPPEYIVDYSPMITTNAWEPEDE